MIFKGLDDGRFVIKLRKKYSLGQFLNNCGVRSGTYGENFSSSLYKTVFVNAIEINQEYSKYYSSEYDSIKDLLFWKYFLPKDIIEELFRDEKTGYLVIINEFAWKQDYDGHFIKSIETVFKKLDINNENQN